MRRHQPLRALTRCVANSGAIDTDHSGFITYDELRDAVRTKLHKKPSVMSDTTIKALFCSLDQDNSNELSRDEMAKFFALGYDEVHATASINDHKLTSVIERHGMSAPIASTATSDMRTELKEAGLEIPGEDEMRGLSVKFNEWVEQYRQDERLPPSTSWFNLFSMCKPRAKPEFARQTGQYEASPDLKILRSGGNIANNCPNRIAPWQRRLIRMTQASSRTTSFGIQCVRNWVSDPK